MLLRNIILLIHIPLQRHENTPLPHQIVPDRCLILPMLTPIPNCSFPTPFESIFMEKTYPIIPTPQQLQQAILAPIPIPILTQHCRVHIIPIIPIIRILDHHCSHDAFKCRTAFEYSTFVFIWFDWKTVFNTSYIYIIVAAQRGSWNRRDPPSRSPPTQKNCICTLPDSTHP
ncbi:hypothetical protein BDP27DRAFT_445830 [Rhodocollybia butyracea]|uniref:Uncharacterized protein n=1 Tax=Rhodocollybia butyracea TaxID=206335 RepID=A0A9P5PYW0_9AGAR|nr:hypothetical protein BDP27DRAFT_445830 [Rhodocollybia butyracea]